MEIHPGKQGFFRSHANVRIDSFNEMYLFGAAAPLLSKERQRWMNYTTHGLWPGRSFPESYPATLSVPESILARIAGNLMLFGGGVRPGWEEANLHMIEEISGYFTHTSPSERARLASIGKQMVDDYEIRHRPSTES